MNNSVIFVPNENIINAKPDIRYLKNSELDVPKIKELSHEYNLGITSEMLGISDNDNYGVEWQRKIASLGHVLVTTGDFVVVYLPKMITKKQKEWFNMNQFYFENHKKLLAFEQLDENMNILKWDQRDDDVMFQIIEESLMLEESSDLKL